MGMLGLKIKDDLEEEFRRFVFETKGMKKGNISLALEEAIEMWIEDARKKKKAKTRQASEGNT
jgi:hypothetical protein